MSEEIGAFDSDGKPLTSEQVINTSHLWAQRCMQEAQSGSGYIAVQAVPLLLEALYYQNLVIIELLKNKPS